MALTYFPQGQFNKSARLYKRYLYQGAETVGDTEIIEQISNYKAYDEIRFALVRKTNRGTYEPLTGLSQDLTTALLQTNSHLEIIVGDFIWFECALFPKGAWFVVSEPAEQQFMYIPKMVKSFQYLALSKVTYNPNKINA